ncbi:hypothetical protein GCM10007079_05420 [Nocardiopsis terrae]|uniref:Lactococcin 972 family bacteriocin n=1 Tax=Nocardiopsis terrae TaxID=372655 RepID=A0ABR9HNK7_9ACTN|nr:lactococcin 972 family bacteriocin [Nocardiopsis terrae]MBE1460592.1 lactococcin 972 family bacteriocin [Nocardiopsis terrae]GHC72301.1 hypothetical protein GCM10007079_05420 [Nocardiopsis terrae]
MDSLKRILVNAACIAAITTGAAGTALAGHSYIGGGEWHWGITGPPGVGDTYSRYHHGSACHGATAVGTRTVRVRAQAGVWAEAFAPRANGNNQSYWRNDC